MSHRTTPDAGRLTSNNSGTSLNDASDIVVDAQRVGCGTGRTQAVFVSKVAKQRLFREIISLFDFILMHIDYKTPIETVRTE